MTGTNTLELNISTMKEIVQFWLDNKLLNKQERSPQVSDFAAAGNMNSVFRVTLTEPSD